MLLKESYSFSVNGDRAPQLKANVGFFFVEYLEESFGKKDMVVRRGCLNCIIVVLISLTHISCYEIPIGEITVFGQQGPALKSNKESLLTVVGRKKLNSAEFSPPLGIFHLLIITPEVPNCARRSYQASAGQRRVVQCDRRNSETWNPD